MNDPVIKRVREAATAVGDPTITEDQAHIEVELTDGRRLTKFVEQSLGNIHRPLTDRQLDEKFRDQAVLVLPASDVEDADSTVLAIDQLEDVRDVVTPRFPPPRTRSARPRRRERGPIRRVTETGLSPAPGRTPRLRQDRLAADADPDRQLHPQLSRSHERELRGADDERGDRADAAQFGLGSGLFFFRLLPARVPSNLARYRVGARVWISRIMISWGLASAAMSFIVGPTSFYAMRLLFGAAEAGFFQASRSISPHGFRPSSLTHHRVVHGGDPIQSVIGGPVSGLLLRLDGTAGLAGWQWLFLVEGLPVVVVGLSCCGCADAPENTAWLSDEEKAIVGGGSRASVGRRKCGGSVAVRVLILAGIQFGFSSAPMASESSCRRSSTPAV